MRRTEPQTNVAVGGDPWKRDNYRRRQNRQEFGSFSSADTDDAAITSPVSSSSSSSAITRREAMISRKQIWRGHASEVVGIAATKQQDVSHHNGSESIRVLHYTLSVSFFVFFVESATFHYRFLFGLKVAQVYRSTKRRVGVRLLVWLFNVFHDDKRCHGVIKTIAFPRAGSISGVIKRSII